MPRSMFTMDGSLLLCTNKAQLLHVIEEVSNVSLASDSDAEMQVPMKRVLIIDAMTVLQTMRKTPGMKKIICHITESFVT